MSHTPGTPKQYGLGYRLYNASPNVVRGHGGLNEGWAAFFTVIPESKDGFIMITNSYNGIQITEKVFFQKINKYKF